MKTSNRFVLGLLALALLASPLLVGQAQAQYPYDSRFDPASGANSAVNTDVALVVRYIGNQVGNGVSGTVTVAAGGDITFKSGAYGSEAADTTLECPVSGALGGVIDVSDTACDTLGEVVDIINASANWRAVILDGFRSDSSNDTLAAMSETKANVKSGLNLVWDAGVAFKSTIALTRLRSMTDYLSGSAGTTLNPNPFSGSVTSFIIGNEKTTFGSGTSTYAVSSCTERYATTGGAETCTTLYSTAGGDTTVAAVLDFRPYGLLGNKDSKLVVRVTNSAAMTAAVQYAYGLVWFYRGGNGNSN